MVSWWYLEGETKVGPSDTDSFIQTIKTKPLSADTFVWTSGYDDWKKLGNIPEFASYLRQEEMPPPLPKMPPPAPKNDAVSPVSLEKIPVSEPDTVKENAPVTKHLPPAGNWRRFFARTLDLILIMPILTVVSSFTLSYHFIGFSEWISESGSNTAFNLLLFPVGLLIECLIYKLFKSTPGKALFGLQILDYNQKKIPPDSYAGRNFYVWKSAYAFGLPLFNIGTMANQYSSVRKSGKTTYDQKLGFTVVKSKPNIFKATIAIVLFVAGLFGIVIMSKVNTGVANPHYYDKVRAESQPNSVPPFLASPEFKEWQNPVTKLTANLDSNWMIKYSMVEGRTVVNFENKYIPNSYIMLAYENVNPSDIDFEVYAKRLDQTLSNTFSPDRNGTFDIEDGYDVYTVYGKMKNKDYYSYIMQLHYTGNRIWRVITLDAGYGLFNKDMTSATQAIISTLK